MTTTLIDIYQVTEQLIDNPTPQLPLKAAIKEGSELLNQQFLEGRNVTELVRERAVLIDAIIDLCWKNCQLLGQQMTLVAVGGYGRGELHPFSDIDILVLLKTEPDAEAQASLEKFITLLWDLGLDIGHSVRTSDECVAEASKDITIATALMESRVLSGNCELHEQMKQATDPSNVWDSREFFQAKCQEQQNRHDKFANTEYNLEPNVKSSPGGLRDIQVIDWVTKRHFATSDRSQLVSNQFLTDEEFKIIEDGRNFMWQVRWALHMVANRAEDRLLFDYQRQLSEIFGFTDGDERHNIEQFMQRFYRWAIALSELNDLIIQHFNEAIIQACEPEEVMEINTRFRIRNNLIEAANETVFQKHPSALLEVFVLLANNPHIEGVRAATIRLIRDGRHLIDDAFRENPKNRQLFAELLRGNHLLATSLHRMKRYGILGNYLPEFGKIIGQMQHDLFHIYTVDAHTIQVVRNMRHFGYDEYREKFPLASSIHNRMDKVELLYTAGLYHDIAKGRGGDHSELGQEDARQFCINHGYSKSDTNLVVWMVKHHLTMSSIAQRKDISDPEVIRDFANLVGDQRHLDYLYALTVADINATNPTLWTSWRAALMRQLYLETKRALRRGLENHVDKEELVADIKERAIRLLEDKGFDAEDVLNFWDNPGDEYFLRHSPREIAWHTEATAGHGDSTKPLILIEDTLDKLYEGATHIFIRTTEHKYLFANVAACFEQLNLSIQDARIITTESGLCMDTFIVLDANGEAIGTSPQRLKTIRKKLNEYLSTQQQVIDNVSRFIPRQLKHFNNPTNVTIITDTQKEQTIIEVITPDRPGLLALVGLIFAENQLMLQNAKISTLGERVEDVFFITDNNGKAIEDADVSERICQQLRLQLDQNVNDQ
ncbi:Bifunctional uridylyltransferase/uridylyl-removing enzyme [Sinobacterium norvegicum]|uniref:Bifunctional uridylyltransferase/uridylyl-removing enzyme n=1 Tax=Sinobacterium norvegicum TaxID=1641715 RepID=A0ABM9ACL9_9GAMM|nr:[protein-PII] uridylyltransferase [Sinobacterium norvegicum]CAH0990715.1 Bifunctional uridylyltransferase/uridylyl-removing enzyme [Sinobacterium norvegicum]